VTLVPESRFSEYIVILITMAATPHDPHPPHADCLRFRHFTRLALLPLQRLKMETHASFLRVCNPAFRYLLTTDRNRLVYHCKTCNHPNNKHNYRTCEADNCHCKWTTLSCLCMEIKHWTNCESSANVGIGEFVCFVWSFMKRDEHSNRITAMTQGNSPTGLGTQITKSKCPPSGFNTFQLGADTSK
jgi:hypothetical protein